MATPITTTMMTTLTLITATTITGALTTATMITERPQFVLTGTTAIIRMRVRPMATTGRATLSVAFL